MRIQVLLTLSAILTGPVAAAETAWQALAPGVTARLISSDQRGADGKTLVGLQLEMPETVKTYWKVPGETGIPTEISLQGSSGVSAAEPLWPYPKIDRKGGYTDFVYYGPLVLPISLAVDGDAEIALSVTLGICSDICVPATARFSLPLDLSAPDRGQGLRIRQAVTDVPLPWTSGPEPVGEVRWSAEQNGLLLEIDPGRADPGSVIASVEGGALTFGAPQKSQEGDLVLLPLLGNNTSDGTAPRSVSLIFLTADGPYEVTRDVIVAQGSAAP